MVLLIPGSFVVLPVLWLVAVLKRVSNTNNRESFCSAAPGARPDSVVIRRPHRWWQSPDAAERFLADATSLAELERRMRVLERGSGEPAFVTFNH